MNKFLAIVKLLPLITALVRAVEELIPGSGKGKQKLNLVLGIADIIYQSEADLSAVWPDPILFTAVVTSIVTSIVGTLNATGDFPKGN